ncbi:MAG: alpha-E domain-containing protein [Planctomycetes bacterium]|nr:alpha-E domain-containing protein [Planctomycetota bacterium]
MDGRGGVRGRLALPGSTNVERAEKTSRILDVKYFILVPKYHDNGSSIDDPQWSSVLRSVSGFEMFRKRHHGITPERGVGFLILDRLQIQLNEVGTTIHDTYIAVQPDSTRRR